MGIRIVSAMLLTMLILAGTAPGAEVRGRSSTQLLWYNDEFTDRRALDLTEYLRASITKIDKEGKFSLYGYGRATQDLNRGEGAGGRLYNLYGDYRDLFGRLDLRVGRQFAHNAAGSVLVDGVEAVIRNVGPVAFSIMGGRDVIFGLDNRELSKNGDYAMGLSAFLAGYRNTDLEVSWLRKWDEGDVSRDLVGVDFKQYFFNSLKLYADARYDVTSESFNEALVGVKYYPIADLVLTGEWFRSYPAFDATSIFAVFAVNRYQEGLFRVDYTLSDRLSANAGYTYEEFGDGARGHVYHAGVGVRPVEPIRVDVEYDNRQGFNGSTNGVLVDVAWDLARGAQVAGGLSYDVYQRDALTNDEIARRYWLGGKYKPAPNLAFSLRLDYDVNARFKGNSQGRFVCDYDF